MAAAAYCPLERGQLGAAFDNFNHLSAPRVEHERPFYRFERTQIETAIAAV